MRYKLFLLIFLLTLPALAGADTIFTTPIVRDSLDRFRVETFTIKTSVPDLIFDMEIGYDSGGFLVVKKELVRIGNRDIAVNGKNVYTDDNNDMMLDLPSAYQLNPASKILQEINDGTFGGQPTLKEYIEIIIKTLLKL